MLTSIKKKTTSFLAKVLIVIIILPFLFWGMGDVFRGGNQNVLATIDSEKISAQGFVEYLNRLNLNDQQIYEATQSMIEHIQHNLNITNITNNDDFVEFNIEFYILESNLEDEHNYFKSCSDINKSARTLRILVIIRCIC